MQASLRSSVAIEPWGTQNRRQYAQQKGSAGGLAIGHCLHLALGCCLLLSIAAVPAAAAEDAGQADGVSAASDPVYIPDVSHLLPPAVSRESLSRSLQIVVLLTLLAVAPGLLLLMTCFVRVLVVLALLRQALGTQQLPPSQIMIGLALFMTFLAMAPTWERIRTRAIDPYLEGRLPQLDAIAAASAELREFMFAQIEAAQNEEDVYLMYDYAARQTGSADQVIRKSDVPMTALIPAFVLSELKTAFVLGFRIYLPFLVIDMVIATVLVSMGMMMLPPVLISLPFKLLLFVLADGWHLVAAALMASVC
jgi:flagellar biosynthetic protein FliP